jgi:hypothetical protein
VPAQSALRYVEAPRDLLDGQAGGEQPDELQFSWLEGEPTHG